MVRRECLVQPNSCKSPQKAFFSLKRRNKKSKPSLQKPIYCLLAQRRKTQRKKRIRLLSLKASGSLLSLKVNNKTPPQPLSCRSPPLHPKRSFKQRRSRPEKKMNSKRSAAKERDSMHSLKRVLFQMIVLRVTAAKILEFPRCSQ